MSFIAQSIRGFSARKTQLLLEFKNNAKKLNSGHRTFTQLQQLLGQRLKKFNRQVYLKQNDFHSSNDMWHFSTETQLLLEFKKMYKNKNSVHRTFRRLQCLLAQRLKKSQKKSTGMSIGSWLNFIAQSIRGFSTRKTQLLLEFKNNAKFLNSGYRTFTQLYPLLTQRLKKT